MGLPTAHLYGLKIFSPSSLLDNNLNFFEFMKYDTKLFKQENLVLKSDLFNAFITSNKSKLAQSKKITKKQLEEFFKKLDQSLFIKNTEDEITDIKWEKIEEFCDLLRLIERSDERKIRWALYNLFRSGKTKISIETIQSIVDNFKIKNLPKILNKIIKDESHSGFDASFDGKFFIINHPLDDKLVNHYLADAIEESYRRSPGELEKEVLEFLDEGSYSNLELSQAIIADEALISRTISKLRKQDKIVLSSFGQRGMRYFTTNCDNCPFGTTRDSCKKEALSYIISAFHTDYGIELTSKDFEFVETNQALLKIKRIIMNARKDKNTKLEKNLGLSLAALLGMVVDKSLNIKIPNKKSPIPPDFVVNVEPILAKLPLLYQLGLKKGAQGGINLMDEMLHFASNSIKKEDRIKIKKQAIQETNKFLKNIGINE